MNISASTIKKIGFCGTLLEGEYCPPDFALWVFSLYLDAKGIQHLDNEVYGREDPYRSPEQIAKDPQITIDDGEFKDEMFKLIYPSFGNYVFKSVEVETVGLVLMALRDQHNIDPADYAFVEIDGAQFAVFRNAEVATLVKLSMVVE